jgi:hypothetical protein
MMYEVSAFVAVLEGTLALEPHRENLLILKLRRHHGKKRVWTFANRLILQTTSDWQRFRLPQSLAQMHVHESTKVFARTHTIYAHMHTHKRKQIQTFSSSQRLPMSPILCGNLTGECRTVTKDSSLFAL